MLERTDANHFAGMNRRCTVKIIQAAHLPREIWLRHNPTTSQAADTVNFCQTAGHNELRAEMKRSARCSLVNRVEINFINQHERADTARDFANFAQDRFGDRKSTRLNSSHGYI